MIECGNSGHPSTSDNLFTKNYNSKGYVFSSKTFKLLVSLQWLSFSFLDAFLALINDLKLILKSKLKRNCFHLIPVQTDATLLANNSQHCWMLNVASVCTPCCKFLRVVKKCCAKFETGQTFSNVNTDATTPNRVGLTMLGVVMSVYT